jgi:hypothetical protein
MEDKKKIVYLFGTGATQAEANLIDERVSLSMDNIKDGILDKIGKRGIQELVDIKNELAGEKVDIEQLITLYEASSSSKYKKVAIKLRELFREEILEQIGKLDTGSFAVRGKFTPKLCSALIDMYGIKGIDESLCGIMTINYEDMIERAVQSVKGGINYSLNFSGDTKSYIKMRKNGTLVLKLHGSFNWVNEFPISIQDVIENEEDTLWIPPGVEKHNEIYPFNIIWGKARELLDCEILRVVGCSLSRNEWHLVSMLYATQKLNRKKTEYSIEIISPPATGDIIQKTYPHLRIRKIYEIKEVRDSVYKSLYKLDSKIQGTIDDGTIIEYLSNKNIFEFWLRAKGEELISRGFSLNTRKNVFRDYIKGN